MEIAISRKMRFGDGQITPWTQTHEGGLIFEIGPDRVVLDCPIALTVEVGQAEVRFLLAEGSRVVFVLTYSSSTAPMPAAFDVDAMVKATQREWQDWAGRFEAKCSWDGAVRRPLITLHNPIDRESGGFVGSVTFGMPEIPGGSANWDYRYCWLRDSTSMLTALLDAGFQEEAKRWRDWILRAVAGQPNAMQVVYKTDSNRRWEEYAADRLPGSQGAVPVRIGNAASGQVQVDVFGELMDSFDVMAKAGIERSSRIVEVEIAIVEHLEKVWDQPSSDIWESRSDPECYTYSQVMAWVGINRFVAAHADDHQVDPALLARLEKLTEVIYGTVCERGYSYELRHFVQYYGGDTLDASLSLLPLVGFLPADDPRIINTIAAIERSLMEGGLVRRKPPQPHGHDGGAYGACSCWLADCYKMQSRDDEAAMLLERVISDLERCRSARRGVQCG